MATTLRDVGAVFSIKLIAALLTDFFLRGIALWIRLLSSLCRDETVLGGDKLVLGIWNPAIALFY